MDSFLSNIYKAGLYGRLSKEDGDKEVSNSIANQQDLMMDYLKSHPDIEVYSVYTDDGYSGVNFDRPGFQNMMKDIRNGLINCVIVKDLSRFGRNYTEVGRYLEKIFPLLGVRFISITDGIDSLNENDGYGNNMIIPFKNLINDAYARDISIKVRANLQTKRKKGDYIGAFVVYGYMKSPENKNRLIIDDYAAEVVKDIFAMKLCGMSHQMIADKLNKDGILCPYEYKKSIGININDNFKKSAKALWSYNSVLRILKNPIYTGMLVQGRHTTPNYKVKKKILKSIEECECVEDNHEAIISKHQFDIVQGLLMRDTRISTSINDVSILGGLVFCGDCHKPMVRSTVPAHGKKYVYYICSLNKKDKKSCSSHRISENALVECVTKSCIFHINQLVSYAEKFEMIENAPYMRVSVAKCDMNIEKKQEELKKFNRRKRNLYDDYKDGILTKEEYQEFRDDYDRQIKEINFMISSYQNEKNMILDNSGVSQLWIQEFKKYKGLKTLDRNVVSFMIDRIYVYGSDRIEIVFRFQDRFNAMVEFVDGYPKPVKEAI